MNNNFRLENLRDRFGFYGPGLIFDRNFLLTRWRYLLKIKL